MAPNTCLSLHAFNRAIQRGIPMDAELVAYCQRIAPTLSKKPQKFTFLGYSIVAAIHHETGLPTVLTIYRSNKESK